MSLQQDLLDWRAIPHREGCRRRGWDLRVHTVDRPRGGEVTTVQAVCPQDGGCGTYHEWKITIAADRDEHGDPRSKVTTSGGPVEGIGYGVRPVPVPGLGVWLHPGPALLGWPESRPDYFAVTRSKTPPATWADVLGVIAPARRRGRQVKSRWSAGAHFTPSRYGAHPRHTHDALTSRTAAATWVVQHAAEPANGGS